MSRNAAAMRAMTDTRYGAGRQSATSKPCAGCSKTLRRSSRAAIWLCDACKSHVERAYDARLRAQGIEPSVMPGNKWLPAWATLSAALTRGDREMLTGLLPVAAVAV